MISLSIFIELSGWLPAIIFPCATMIQLLKIIKNGNAQGVSSLTWFLFGIANIGLYIYAEKYFTFQAIVGFLGTALLDFIIVFITFFYKYKEKQ